VATGTPEPMEESEADGGVALPAAVPAVTFTEGEVT